ncbi:MAG: protein kinase [Thermodesulfobacteriota bacterium]
MMKTVERRQWERRDVPEPELGVVYRHLVEPAGGRELGSHYPLFVGMHNTSPGGMLLELSRLFAPGDLLNFTRHDPEAKAWRTALARVVWTQRSADRRGYLTGLEYVREGAAPPAASQDAVPPGTLLADLDFLLGTRLLRSLPRHAVWPLLNCLSPEERQAGARLLGQGEAGEHLYLIQEGACTVRVEKDGTYHTVARLGSGDVAGEMGVLTGEARCASVDADTPVRLWRLEKRQFEAVAARHPDLRLFLTELLTRRLETSPLVADRTIGRYLIRSKLGQGAWSIVYQGIHASLGMPVAIKMLKHAMAMDPDFQKRFKDEAQIIAGLGHRNIVQIYDIEDRYQTVFLITELLDGEGLDRRLARTGPLPAKLAADLLIQVLAGLSHAHGKGIVHQDIKPANLMLLPSGQIKILDFGLACPSGSEVTDFDGTPYYMSPEQIDGETVDRRADIFSLGITAFEMVTGRRPFPEDDLAALMEMHLSRDIPDPAALVPDLPPPLAAFIRKACRRQPAERFQTAAEALDALAPLVDPVSQGDQFLGLPARRMTSLFVFYQDEQRGELNRLLEEFCGSLQHRGIVVKAAEFKDV